MAVSRTYALECGAAWSPLIRISPAWTSEKIFLRRSGRDQHRPAVAGLTRNSSKLSIASLESENP